MGALPVGGAIFIAAFAVFLGGLVYWYSWLYRIHKILLEATNSTYSVAPRKAIGYRLIPFYNLVVWNFRWTNQIADLVRQNSKDISMRKAWVGVWLIFATLLFFVDRGLELVVLFCISAYLTRKIKGILPLGLTTFAASPPNVERFAYAARVATDETAQHISFAPAAPRVVDAWDFHLAKAWGLPVSSGVGAAFGFLMCYGLWLNMMEREKTIGTFALNVVVVAIVLYFFLEPLVDKLLEGFDAADQHRHRTFWQRMFRFTVFVLIIDVAHSLLERATEQGGGYEVAKFGILFTAFFGGMTFLWIISGARTKLPEALALVGVGTLVLMTFGMFAMNKARDLSQELTVHEFKNDGELLRKAKDVYKDTVQDFQSGQIPNIAKSSAEKVGADTGDPKDREKTIPVAIELGCAVFVALAGFVAMRTTFRPMVVASTVFGTSVIAGLILARNSWIEPYHIVTALWSAFWWCLGILVFYDHELFSQSSEPSLQPHSEPGPDHELPHVVWLVSFIILISLIAAALLYPPPATAIGSRILTLQANDTQSYYGAKPALTYSASEDKDTVESVITSGAPSLYAAAGMDSPPGTYPIFVVAAAKVDEEKYALRSLPGTLTIVQARTQTKLMSDAANAVGNSPVTFTASVSSIDGAGTPSGAVTFNAGPAQCGTKALSNGTASCTVSGLPLGDYSITAKYSGDANFSGSISPQWTQRIIEPEIHRPLARTVVIPKGKEIYIVNIHPIDSNTSQPSQPLMARLAVPISVNGHVLAQKDATAILWLSNIDREGHLGGRPSLIIHLMQIEIAGQNYPLQSTLEVEGPPQGRAGHVYIPQATILTFKLQSPVAIDVSSLDIKASRSATHR